VHNLIKIVLSGGPCAGKTTLTTRISRELPEKGFYVFIISEAASGYIISGVKPGHHVSMENFQDFIMDQQIFNEAMYDRLEQFYDTNKIVLIFDRGLCDQMAYVSEEHFLSMLEARGLTITSARDRYDGVIFLQSAANGAEQFYTMVNEFNGQKVQIRYETVEEARALNDRTLKAWIGHPHLRVIGNEGNFESKIDRAMQEVYNIIGIPVVTETERKFLIKKPAIELINSIKMCSRTDIVNTYLKGINYGVERRVRQRGLDGDYSFYYTEKTDIPGNDVVRNEVERRISQREYINYLMEADMNLRQVAKHRYCLVYKNQYFEIDMYDFDEQYAILELELGREEQEITIPSYIEIVKEVTSDRRFRNKQIAKNLKFPVV